MEVASLSQKWNWYISALNLQGHLMAIAVVAKKASGPVDVCGKMSFYLTSINVSSWIYGLSHSFQIERNKSIL